MKWLGPCGSRSSASDGRAILIAPFLYSTGAGGGSVRAAQLVAGGGGGELAADALVGPPPVGNLTVGKSGADVVATWNAASCPAPAVNLYRGSLGSFAAFTGGTCSLPASGSATLTLPDNVWFLLAAVDGAGADGSYGLTGSGAERTISGASAVCPAVVQHVTSGSCP